MLKDSSSLPRGSLQPACIKSTGLTGGVPQDPFPIWKVMLTLTWGLVVTGLIMCGLVGWEGDCVRMLGWDVTGSVLEINGKGSDNAEDGLLKRTVDCKGLMDSWLLEPSVLVKVSVLLLHWLQSLLTSPVSNRYCSSGEAGSSNEVSRVSST